MVPVIEALAKCVAVPIGIDTSKPEVMRAAVAAGAGLINDVYALRRDGALDAAAELKVPVFLMHMQGEPRTMQERPHYDDVVDEVHRFLADRCSPASWPASTSAAFWSIRVSVSASRWNTISPCCALWIVCRELGGRVLVGLSRKAMIGTLTGRANVA